MTAKQAPTPIPSAAPRGRLLPLLEPLPSNWLGGLTVGAFVVVAVVIRGEEPIEDVELDANEVCWKPDDKIANYGVNS